MTQRGIAAAKTEAITSRITITGLKIQTEVTRSKLKPQGISSCVRRWPSKFIGFAKHHGTLEAGQILLESEGFEILIRKFELHALKPSA